MVENRIFAPKINLFVMKIPDYLFETSWEVCNMVGGIYTVLSSKSNVVQQLLGDHYITVGPDVVKEAHETLYFIEDNNLFQNGVKRL